MRAEDAEQADLLLGRAAGSGVSESLRLQLEGTSVAVKELIPPSVATDLLPGQRESASRCRWTTSPTR